MFTPDSNVNLRPHMTYSLPKLTAWSSATQCLIINTVVYRPSQCHREHVRMQGNKLPTKC